MTRFSSLRAPRIPDVLGVAISVGVMCVELAVSADAQSSPQSVALIALAALPVLARRHAPEWALLLAMVTLSLLLPVAHTYMTAPLPAILCAYSLADSRGRRRAAWAAILTLPVVLAILHFYSPHGILTWETAKNLGLIALPLALGVASHDRRAVTTVLLERAEAAERTREEESMRRVSDERLRIAREVHDIVAHSMVAINVQAGVGAHLLERDPSRAYAALREIKRVSGEGLNDLRSLLGILRDGDGPDTQAPVSPTQGLDDIEDLRDGLRSAGVALELSIDPSVAMLPASVGATGYRIVQEALTNVMRHAGPTRASVRVTRDQNHVMIEVEDEGSSSATSAAHTGSGNGVRGMRERAQAAGGSLEVGPVRNGGWRVAASLPAENS